MDPASSIAVRFTQRVRTAQPLRCRRLLLAVTGSVLAVAALQAQGVSTVSVAGSVRSARGGDLDSAQIQIVHRPTGYRLQATSRRRRLTVSGLDAGCPYLITVPHIGHAPSTR